MNRTPVLVITAPDGSVGLAIQPGQDGFAIACEYAELIGIAAPEKLSRLRFEIVPESTVREAKGTV